MLREFEIKPPALLIERFYIEIPGNAKQQRWTRQLLSGDELEFWYETEEPAAWLPCKIHRWDIYDGSGNAPGDNAHYILVVERGGKMFKLELEGGIRVRVDAPSDEFLQSAPKFCEAAVLSQEETRWNPACYRGCTNIATQYAGESWRCAEHLI